MTFTLSYLQDHVSHLYSHERARTKDNILVADNSALTTWGECERKYLYRVIMSLRERDEKVAITFGKAFHKFLEHYHGKTTPQEYANFNEKEKYAYFISCFEQFVIGCTKENSRITVSREQAVGNDNMQEYSMEFGFLLCQKYVNMHPVDREYFRLKRDSDGNAYAEMGFAIDLPNGIIIGMIDGIGELTRSDKDVVVEHKSTKYNLNSAYFSDFNPNNQVSTYLFAASEFMGKPITTALINAIRVKDYKRGDPEETQEKLFGRIETSREPEQLEQRMKHADFDLKMIRQSIEAGIDGFPMRTNSCRTRFGECEYRKLCMAKDDKMIQVLAESAYVVEPWQPYKVFEDVEKVIEIDTLKEKNVVDVKDAKEFV